MYQIMPETRIVKQSADKKLFLVQRGKNLGIIQDTGGTLKNIVSLDAPYFPDEVKAIYERMLAGGQ